MTPKGEGGSVVLRRTLAFAVAILLVGAPSAFGQEYVAGSDGLGDPFFPKAGNGGYDTTHYSLTLDYDQPANFLEGTAVINAKATQNLRRFNLDCRDFYAISSVTVNGEPANIARPGQQELAISPVDRLDSGSDFTVEVDYAGKPKPIKDPDKSIEGWIPTDDGAFVVNEPQGAPGWFPVNDNPQDKATYDFTITVPAGHTAIANGQLVSHSTAGGKETWHWSENSPMASYLTTATNGVFETESRPTRCDTNELLLCSYTTDFGLQMYDAVDPNTRQLRTSPPNPTLAYERLDPQPGIITFFSDLYGEYPFTSGGGIIDWAPDVGYALESQTRPNYHRIPGPSTVVHEISHMWFGDDVTIKVWPDIWLNEGFATFSEWIYAEEHVGDTAAETFDELYATPESDPFFDELWFPAPAALHHPSQLFHTPVYDRGAMTLQALREKVGDETFFGILRAWYAENTTDSVTPDKSVTTEDFIALAERETGQQLDNFFQVWLYEEGRPESW
jgi:aminopeptidase N